MPAREGDRTAIYAIGIGRASIGRGWSSCGESGGEPTSRRRSTSRRYRRIIDDLRRRYVIGYTSTNTNRDGKWRNVEIRTKGDNTTVKSRGGYFAPEK